MPSLVPILTPTGRLLVAASDDGFPIDPVAAQHIELAFARGPGHGLLHLGAAEPATPLPPTLGYWRDLGARFVTAVCGVPDAAERGATLTIPPPSPDRLASTAAAAPPMTGAE